MFELSLYYDTGKNSRHPGSYEVFIASYEGEARPFRQRGETWNNVTHYEGVFSTQREAVQAALSYINTPCKMVERTDVLSGDTKILVQFNGEVPPPMSGFRHRLLGAISPHGVFIAGEA